MKDRDVFHPGITEEQVKRAEKMLGSLNLTTFIEKRSSSSNYWPGVLVAPGQAGTPIKVLVSTAPEDRPNERILLSAMSIPRIEYCELVIEKGSRKNMLRGRVEASRPGQRSEDQKQAKPLNIARFYQQPE